jgi:hypothetical protein
MIGGRLWLECPIDRLPRLAGLRTRLEADAVLNRFDTTLALHGVGHWLGLRASMQRARLLAYAFV